MISVVAPLAIIVLAKSTLEVVLSAVGVASVWVIIAITLSVAHYVRGRQRTGLV